MKTTTTDLVSQTRYSSGIQVLWSETATTEKLCRSIGDTADKHDIALAIIWFSATRHQPDILVSHLQNDSPTLNFCGCSTSGEVTPDGMQEHGFIAILLPARWFIARSAVMHDAASLGMENIAEKTSKHRSQFLESLPQTDDSHTQFALLLIDGLSYSEEPVTVAIDRGLEGIPLVGGSAGDDLRFEKTWQINNHQALSGAAILTLIDCKLPCRLFTNNNFMPTKHKLVVTEADPDLRQVSEFNAEPAALAYANAIGMRPDDLDSSNFASYSLIIRFGGEYYCRSIKQLNEDMSLSFFCAIDNGLVLTVARSEGMVASSKLAIEQLEQDMGAIDIMFGFDCIYRKLDALHRQTTHRIAELYRQKRFVGFNTYGEQYNSMHINQTFTGIAIGMPPEQAEENQPC